ncbi:MAG: IPT/TIG domain-containing protein [Acidobacteria bacterium]|nr:IPT/TIG domain-containing protein [Acidobacteriota bacterium]
MVTQLVKSLLAAGRYGLLMIVLLPVVACRQGQPRIEQVHSDKILPGAVITLAGDEFGEDPSRIEAKVGDQAGRVRQVASTSLELELPRGLHAGRHELVLTNLETGESSDPYQLNILEVVRIPPGTRLVVQTVESIGSDRSRTGDTFLLTLDRPVVVRGMLVADRGSRVVGRVTNAVPPGRVKGRAEIAFTLAELLPLNTDRTLALETNTFSSRAHDTHRRDALTIGATTGIGALIGAIAGGGKGAAIGAASGAAAGTGTVLVTRGDQVTIPSGASFTFGIAREVSFEIEQPLPTAPPGG